MLLALVTVVAASPLVEAALTVRVPGVAATIEEAPNRTIKITGKAPSHEAVADYMRALAALVQTPKGMGRVIERMRGRSGARVELLTGGVQEFAASDLIETDVELIRAASRADKAQTLITFDIRLRVPRV